MVISVIEHLDNMCVVKWSVFGYGVIAKRRQILVIGLLAKGMHLTSPNHQ